MQAQVFEYRLIAEAIPQIVWISNPQGLAEFFNARWFEYTGLAPDECVGDGWAQAVHPGDVEAAIALRFSSLETGEMFETEFRLRRADGVYRWFLVRALPMRTPTGEISMWMGTCTDIEQQKRAELQLRFLLEAGRTLVIGSVMPPKRRRKSAPPTRSGKSSRYSRSNSARVTRAR